MARIKYPDTPLGHARQIRDRASARLIKLGHKVKWVRGCALPGLRNAAGFRGTCQSCRGVAAVAWLVADPEDGGCISYEAYEGAMQKRLGPGPRRCAGSRS
jgi:hypothetical protein